MFLSDEMIGDKIDEDLIRSDMKPGNVTICILNYKKLLPPSLEKTNIFLRIKVTGLGNVSYILS